MRLEVFCEDRIGLTRELLDLLVLRHIDLRGIEIDPAGRIYLNFASLSFDDFRGLMAEIRRIDGISDVRTVAFMPSEREHRALNALLESMPEPVLSLDLRGKVELINAAALRLFGLPVEKSRNLTLGQLIHGYNFTHWLELGSVPETERVVIQSQDFLLEITPVYLDDDTAKPTIVGALIMLKSAARMGRQLQAIGINDDSEFDHLVAISPKMRQVIDQARKLAMLDAPLLIVGETGTGKDMLARACHLRSTRGKEPFLALNCAALPDDVMESELYGYAPGAYPNALEGKKGFFEQANGGSVLLDEVGEMSPQMQTKLLRFLNDGTFRRVGEEHEVHVDVRVICATQKNLLELVQHGQFREDLYYRLNVLTLTLPPLRDRPADIMPLTELFVARFADEQGIPRPKLVPELRNLLPQYGWPGNVRQLKNTIYRALAQLNGNELRLQDIDLPAFVAELPQSDEPLEGSLDDISKRFERSVLTRLYQTYPSTRKLAKRLGVSHTAIANKLREYGLSNRKVSEEEDE
ncbi:transcriptional regulator TyrR [Pectobacteriaceae bacterium CE70]|uniref:HTH-type transcriptional regulatory protein TyrR n=1 Tax=Serratia sp. (strain ATCC 39006) TaxID=104623 RepID=A0A2I5T7K2_SERS3|nr:transcriptional regulator TyrR [Serratia sp. ATCC 39006]AUH00548.1 transcriptional regulator TyrR [Serratia sp. ATCC 39006]AUH04869.1 transcriptional regulator TyrR [Serratia sp. ATCC 39006]WJV68786.1 transcriptional regulator TyrR [Pectobacteriaceae bacterium CE70]WJY12709.1 transcriptional regulator TyrR [Pectobacteriaceae bacterium C80]